MLGIAEVLLFVVLLSALGITELSRRRLDAIGANPFWSYRAEPLAKTQHALVLAVTLVVVSIGTMFFALAQERSKQLLLQAEVERDARKLAAAESYQQVLLGSPAIAAAAVSGSSNGPVQLRLAESANWQGLPGT
jgi:hypothetical protein